MANIYPVTGALIGGGDGALDKIDGADLANGDVAVVAIRGLTNYGNFQAVYVNATVAGDESVPWVITPDSNAGDKRWVLVSANTYPLVTVATSATITTAQIRSGYIQSTGLAKSITLPAAAVAGFGSAIIVENNNASHVKLYPNSSEKINYDGTAGGVGSSLQSEAGIGKFVSLISSTDTDGSGTDGWRTFGKNGTWTFGT